MHISAPSFASAQWGMAWRARIYALLQGWGFGALIWFLPMLPQAEDLAAELEVRLFLISWVS